MDELRRSAGAPGKCGRLLYFPCGAGVRAMPLPPIPRFKAHLILLPEHRRTPVYVSGAVSKPTRGETATISRGSNCVWLFFCLPTLSHAASLPAADLNHETGLFELRFKALFVVAKSVTFRERVLSLPHVAVGDGVNAD